MELLHGGVCGAVPNTPLVVVLSRASVPKTGSTTPEFVGTLGTGARILPWMPYGEGGEIKSSKDRLGDNLFLDSFIISWLHNI
jgi:hypothetical protein